MIGRETLLWWAAFGVQVVLILRGVSQQLFRRYLWFYALLFFMIGSSLLDILTREEFGAHSEAYYYAYYGAAAILPFFRCVVLWTVAQGLPAKHSIEKSDLIFSLVMLLILCGPLYPTVFAFPGANFFAVYFATLSPVIVAFFIFIARLIMRTRNRVDLGKNVVGIVTGTGLMILADAVNYERAFLLQSTELFHFLAQFSNFLALGVWAIDLWNYDPPRLRASDSYPSIPK